MTGRDVRGICQVCGFSGALRNDGALYRHWAGFYPARPDGTCTGWGQMPKQAAA